MAAGRRRLGDDVGTDQMCGFIGGAECRIGNQQRCDRGQGWLETAEQLGVVDNVLGRHGAGRKQKASRDDSRDGKLVDMFHGLDLQWVSKIREQQASEPARLMPAVMKITMIAMIV